MGMGTYGVTIRELPARYGGRLHSLLTFSGSIGRPIFY
jgi:hypothetical protein